MDIISLLFLFVFLSGVYSLPCVCCAVCFTYILCIACWELSSWSIYFQHSSPFLLYSKHQWSQSRNVFIGQPFPWLRAPKVVNGVFCISAEPVALCMFWCCRLSMEAHTLVSAPWPQWSRARVSQGILSSSRRPKHYVDACESSCTLLFKCTKRRFMQFNLNSSMF